MINYVSEYVHYHVEIFDTVQITLILRADTNSHTEQCRGSNGKLFMHPKQGYFGAYFTIYFTLVRNLINSLGPSDAHMRQ